MSAPRSIGSRDFPEYEDIQKRFKKIRINRLKPGFENRIRGSLNDLLFMSEEGYLYYLPVYVLAVTGSAPELIGCVLSAIKSRGMDKFNDAQRSAIKNALSTSKYADSYAQELVDAFSSIESA
ncbi:MAG: hypothetical protein AAF800_01405 [Planctomycetota bacterium]